MAIFGPAGQMSLAQVAANSRMPSGIEGWAQTTRAFMAGQAQQSMTPFQQWAQMASLAANAADPRQRTVSRTSVISPGPTQVIRPSAQVPQRRAAAPQAGASSSLITSTPSPAEVALATTTLLGG
jgi:hypothetical protein